MKKVLSLIFALTLVLTLMLGLASCGNNDNNDDITDVGSSENPDNNGGSGNTNNGGNTEQSKCVPVYQGMTITNNNTTISLTSASYRSGGIMPLSANSENNGNNGNHYGQYKGDHTDRDDVVDNDNPYPDNSENKNIEEEIKSSLNVIGATNELYYATQDQDIYINIHIYNPDNFEIMSFTLNGKKYSSYMFEEGSDMETIVLKYNVGAVSGIVEYTIDAIKYIDGTEIKDVIIDGDKTVKAGIKTANQLTASISNVDIDTNALSFNANIIDKDNLIAFSSGALKAVIYDGAEIVAQKDLTVGENSITFDNLKTNTLYQYAIVGYYDDLSGDGFKMNVLYKDALYTDAIVLFDNIIIGQESISFSYIWHEDYQGNAISTLKLYKDGAFVKDIALNATSVSELLSGNTYKLVAEYSHGGNTESVYIEFTTLAKAIPEISVVTLSNTQTSISFEVNKIDVDNVCAITKIELVHQNGTIIADSLEQRVFENLLSGNEYTIKITYKYDLNDGDGEKVSTKEINVSTISKVVPTLSITTIEKTKDSISFGVVENDIDNVGAITQIELINPRGTIVADSIDQRTFSNLLSNNEYTLKITYTYDLNDGKGAQTITQTEQITTDAKSAPSITFDNAVSNSSAISFGINEIDADGIGEIIKIELLLGNDVVRTTTDGTVRTFTDLLSNTEYTVRMTYKYNLSNGSEDVTLTRTITIRTSENTIPSILISAGNQTQTSISFAIEESDISGVGSVSKIELLKNGILVKTAENNNVREFTGLLSNTEYTVRVSYDYDLNDGSGKRTETREIKIKTFSKIKPSIIFETTDRTKTSISFDFNIVDVDNIGYIERIDLLRNGDVVSVTTNGNDREFVNLLSDTKYTVKVIFAYDLNDGNGVAYIEKTADITTYAKTTPEISVSNPTKTQTSVGFTINETDADNVGSITKIELVHANGTVVADTLEQRAFANLLSNNAYTIKVTYVYDLNDGTGSKAITKNLTITTLAKVTPTVSINNTTKTQTSVGFEISENDKDNICSITKIELVGSNGTIVANSIDQRAFTNLLSNNNYTVRVTYVYDLNDGKGTQTVTAEAVIETLSKTAPSVTINKTHSESNWVYVDVSRRDSDNTITRIEASILLNGEVVKVQIIDSSCTIEDLLYSTSYTVCVTTYYDMNDGKGEQSKTATATFATSNYVDSQGISYKTYADGTAEVVGFTEGVTELTIPESVDGYSVTSIASNVFQNSNIVSIVIPSSVQKIGTYAFSRCYSLKKVELNEGLAEIGAYAFEHCEIERFVIPLSVSKVGYLAFNAGGCTTYGYHYAADVNIYIKASEKPIGWDGTVMCTRCQRPFWGFDKFVEQDGMIFALSNNKTAEVVCATQKTSNITIPDVVNNCSIIGIGPCAFSIYGYNGYYDHTKYNIEFPEKLEYIDHYAFAGIETQQIILPETLTFIGYEAFKCADIEYLSINSKYIEIASYAFERCNEYRQESMTVNISLNTQGYINGYAFDNCDHIEFLNIPPNLTVCDNAFYECDIIKFCCLADRRPSSWGDEWEDGIPVYWSSYVDDQGVVYKLNSSIYVDGNPTFTVTDCISKNVSRVFISDKLLGRIVYMIGEEAFWDTDVSSIYIPKSVEVIAERAWDTDAYGYYQVGSRFWSSYGDGGFYIQDGIVYDDIYGEEYCVVKALFEAYRYEIYGSFTDFEIVEVGAPISNLEIPSHFEGVPVTTISNNAFNHCYSLTNVIIPEGVTSIGNYAFYNCYNLTSVVIPDTVTNIGDYAFYGCKALVDVTIPDNITSITKNTFAGCNKLIYVEDGVYYVDKWCVGASYDVSCVNIKDGTVEIVDSALEHYNNLVNVTIPSSVTSIGYRAFLHCSNLTSVEFAENSELTRIGDQAFYGCTSLTSVTIPDSVTSIGDYAFYGTKAIVVENGIHYVDKWVVDCDDSITAAVLRNDTVGIADYAFFWCSNLTSIIMPDSVERIGECAFTSCSNLSELTLGNSIEHIGDHAFSNCTSLTSVTIPDSVTSIGSRAFAYCYSLTSVTIGNGVTSIGSAAFERCYKLVEIINYSELIIVAGDISNGYIAYYAKEVHQGESKITKYGDYVFYTYGDVNYLLAYVGNDTAITLPNDYNDEKYEIYQYAFSGCTSLTSVTIPDSVVGLGSSAFLGCTSLTSVTIGNGVTSIGWGAFSGCSSLTSINIPNSVTSIGNFAFSDCTSLTSVTIPDSVTSIGIAAFDGCTRLTSVTFERSNGWWRSSNSTATSGSSIPASNLSNASTAATYLKSTYSEYYLKRT